MSIQSVQTRIAEIQMLTGLQRPQAEETDRSQQDFQALLSRSMAGTSAVDVAQAMGLNRVQTVQAPNEAVVVSAREGTSIRFASAQAGASGTWTGHVDTSDGMWEKAMPYMDIINEASAVYGVPVNVIMGVIKAESDYQPKCLSSAGAMGLMQIMPVNAEYFGVTDAYDPRQNIMCGTEEISRHLRNYDGDLRLALAAYNTGPGNVARRGVTSSSSEEYSRIPASVRAYADRVMRYAGLAS